MLNWCGRKSTKNRKLPPRCLILADEQHNGSHQPLSGRS
nr:MAG TPA: hypothetical protein [Caudoviricetes sp.]DAQ92804.1 MAG TPA: hypothetical protein [Caudoviricetes sp.]